VPLPTAAATFPELNARDLFSSPLAELHILECDVALITPLECVGDMPKLRVLQWRTPELADMCIIHIVVLETCKAALVDYARVADLAFEVTVCLNVFGEFDREEDEVYRELQGMRVEWQAERARLRAAHWAWHVGGVGEVQLALPKTRALLGSEAPKSAQKRSSKLVCLGL